MSFQHYFSVFKKNSYTEELNLVGKLVSPNCPDFLDNRRICRRFILGT